MMAHAERTVEIRRPVESVYDFVLNGANNRLWKSSVLEVRPLGEAPYGAGSKFQQAVQGAEGPVAGDYQVTECRANELIEYEVMTGPMRWRGTYRFVWRGGITQVTLALAGEREGLVQVSESHLQRAMDEEARTLDALKAFLEAHAEGSRQALR